MKRFVVAYFESFSFKLSMTEVEANSKIEALYKGTIHFTGKKPLYSTTDENKFKSRFSEGLYELIEVYEIQ